MERERSTASQCTLPELSLLLLQSGMLDFIMSGALSLLIATNTVTVCSFNVTTGLLSLCYAKNSLSSSDLSRGGVEGGRVDIPKCREQPLGNHADFRLCCQTQMARALDNVTLSTLKLGIFKSLGSLTQQCGTFSRD